LILGLADAEGFMIIGKAVGMVFEDTGFALFRAEGLRVISAAPLIVYRGPCADARLRVFRLRASLPGCRGLVGPWL
jgi:hypothetical protein